jgi:6-phosphofructokinase 1
LDIQQDNLAIDRLGDCRIDSPFHAPHFIDDGEKVLIHSKLSQIKACLDHGELPPAFEAAGPRRKIFFDPARLKCGIVTCGGLCPGLNDVIRSIVLSLHYHYGVTGVYGFRYGYEGLSPRYKHPALELTLDTVADIHQKGGTLLGSSRGPQDIGEMVDTLARLQVGVLFTIGGDGTLRGAQEIAEEIKRRGLKIAVIGIPKTIDNDISWIEMSFGFETAVSEACKAI